MLNRRNIIAYPSANYRAEAKCERRRGTQRQRTVERLQRGFIVPLQDTNDKSSHCQRHRIITAGFDCRMGMVACSLPRSGVKSATQVPLLMAPGNKSVDDGIVGLQP